MTADVEEIRKRHEADDERGVYYCNRWRDTDQPYESLREAHADRGALLNALREATGKTRYQRLQDARAEVARLEREIIGGSYGGVDISETPPSP